MHSRFYPFSLLSPPLACCEQVNLVECLVLIIMTLFENRRSKIGAAGSALRSHPCVAVSSAQVYQGIRDVFEGKNVWQANLLFS